MRYKISPALEKLEQCQKDLINKAREIAQDAESQLNETFPNVLSEFNMSHPATSARGTSHTTDTMLFAYKVVRTGRENQKVTLMNRVPYAKKVEFGYKPHRVTTTSKFEEYYGIEKGRGLTVGKSEILMDKHSRAMSMLNSLGGVEGASFKENAVPVTFITLLRVYNYLKNKYQIK